jgi:TRAP-type mannitol/chloroaromatic compound transport system permease small subunit
VIALARGYVRLVDGMNRRIGRVVMYGIFALMGILLWSSASKVFLVPSLWTLEAAQFAMVAYYILGGPYSIQLGANVRMDLLYGDWSPRRKAWFDLFTICLLMTYLGVLLYGGVASTAYSLGYFGSEPFGFLAGLATGTAETGFLERSPSAWRPMLWPVKAVMVLGILLMLLQCLSELLKDVLFLRGEPVAA